MRNPKQTICVNPCNLWLNMPWNIMNYWYSFSDNYPIADKRLTQAQVNIMRKDGKELFK